MIVVDSSVWIDYFRGVSTLETGMLDEALATRRILVADLVLAEVLQGFSTERKAEQALALLSEGMALSIVDRACAIAAARNYRRLRDRGITIRKTIDVLIATRCILDGLPLLYSDRDFDPFVDHLGLVPALDATPK